jgi:hypothetical protein
MNALTDSNARSASGIEHVMDCLLNQAKSRTELIHTNIQESFPSWKALGIPLALTLIVLQVRRAQGRIPHICYTTFQKHQPLLLLPMLTNICVVLRFLKNDQCGINIHGDQEFRLIDVGNDKSKNDRCGFYFHSLNRICSGTTEIERWIRENDISGNDRSRFHCTKFYSNLPMNLG